MNRIIKKYWKGWLILLFTVLNLSFIMSQIWSYNNSCPPPEENIVIDQESAPINGKCFIENLGLKAEQKTEFRGINQQFRREVCRIIRQLNERKKDMFTELQKDSSDTLHLQFLSKQVGDLHRQLKEETIRFYLSVKSICNPEQKQKLQHCFSPLFENNCCPKASSCRPKECTQEKMKFHKP